MALKLEAGKFYKTRDGRKAFVAAIGSPFPETRRSSQAIGWVQNGDYATSWMAEGGFFYEGNSHERDLVEVWHDPVKVMVYLYRSTTRPDDVRAIEVRLGPGHEKHWTLIAQKEITEGEGVASC